MSVAKQESKEEIKKLQGYINNIKQSLDLSVKQGCFDNLEKPTQLFMDFQNLVKYIEQTIKEHEAKP